MCRSQLERHLVFLAEIEGLAMAPAAQIPHMKGMAILSGQEQLGVDAILDHLRRTPFAGDERVPTQMPPEVVGEILRPAVQLPLSADLERFWIEHEDTARAFSVRRSDGVDIDPIRPAVRGVWSCVSRTFGDLVGFDHFDDARLPGLFGVDDMNARRAKPGED